MRKLLEKEVCGRTVAEDLTVFIIYVVLNVSDKCIGYVIDTFSFRYKLTYQTVLVFVTAALVTTVRVAMIHCGPFLRGEARIFHA